MVLPGDETIYAKGYIWNGERKLFQISVGDQSRILTIYRYV